MTHQEIIIAVMVAVQLFTQFLLWEAVKRGDEFKFKLKRKWQPRDRKTGRFVKKDAS